MLMTVIPEAVLTISQYETEWDSEKLEKKLWEYFKKAAKNIEFRGKPLKTLINQYVDNALHSIFAGLGDREWVIQGQADFTFLFDAGIKDYFPATALRGVDQQSFEQMVLAAYERSFDEQRFGPILGETVAAVVEGPKTKKKVWNAIDTGRKDAVEAGASTVEEFTTNWINTSLSYLSGSCQGSPEDALLPDVAAQIFTALLEQGALPTSLAQTAEPPLAIVGEVVQAAYAETKQKEEAASAAGATTPDAKKRRVGGLLYPKGPRATLFPEFQAPPSAYATSAASRNVQQAGARAGARAGAKGGGKGRQQGGMIFPAF